MNEYAVVKDERSGTYFKMQDGKGLPVFVEQIAEANPFKSAEGAEVFIKAADMLSKGTYFAGRYLTIIPIFAVPPVSTFDPQRICCSDIKR